MEQGKPTYEELEARYRQAESALAAIRSGQADIVIGDHGVLVLKLQEAEKSLRASEEKYRVLMESLSNVIATIDPEGKFLYMNDVAAAQLGGIPSDFVGKPMSDFFPKEIAQKQMEGIQSVLRSNQATSNESISFVKGKPRWYYNSLRPIPNADGSVAYVLLNATDIHELKNTQQELEELNRTLEEKVIRRTTEIETTRQRLELAARSAHLGVWDWNLETEELIWDDQMHLIHGTQTETFTPRMEFVLTNIHPEDRNNFVNVVYGWAKGIQNVEHVEYRIIHKDDSVRHLKSHGSARRSAQNQITHVIGVTLDITEEKIAEQTLRVTNENLARAMHVKDEFLATMSHELRTPLTGILGFSEALQSGAYGQLNDKQSKAVKNVENSGHHLLDLINDVLDLSKIEAGKLELQIIPTSLTDICRASLQLTQGMSRQKNQHVQIILPEQPVYALIDGRRIKQAVVNLLSNAIKFTPENGEVGLILEVHADRQQVCITVWDNGIGIKPENMDKLFQSFVQIDSSLAREYAGTGLGLALVKRITDLHEGYVEVKSDFGKGSRFTITLPWLSESAAESLLHPKTEQPLESAAQQEIISGLILITEDSAIVLNLLGEFLESQGYRTARAASGKEALHYAGKLRPDLILMDIQMPGMDGLEVIRHIRSNQDAALAATPIIALTALAMNGDREQSLAAGANEYISKPVKLQSLHQAIQNLLAVRNK